MATSASRGVVTVNGRFGADDRIPIVRDAVDACVVQHALEIHESRYALRESRQHPFDRRLVSARRKSSPERPIAAQSARNRFPGVVTRVEVDRVAAIVEVQAGPHRLVSLVTAESVHELKLKPGVKVIAVVKATNVMIDLPS